jgi:nicotinamide mononucleotide transporter PnuC
MFISWITNNYGSFILNFYYLIMNILSIFVWKKSIGKDTNKEITSLSLKKTNFILIIIGAVVISVGIMFILTIDSVLHFFGDTSYAKNEIFWIKHYLNSLALTISIIAMLFATLHIRQQWVMWMVSNGATISMWIINIIQFSDEGNTKMLLTSSFTLFTYLFSCVNSVFGYMNWKKLNLAS